MAVLYKDELRDRVCVVHTNVDENSRFAPQGQSPYSPLSEDILKFCSMGNIILLGDFNACSKNEQTTLFDTSEAFYKEVSVRSWTTTTSSRYEWSYGVWQTLFGSFSLHKRWEIQLVGYTLEKPKIIMDWWVNTFYMHATLCPCSLHPSLIELCVKACQLDRA